MPCVPPTTSVTWAPPAVVAGQDAIVILLGGFCSCAASTAAGGGCCSACTAASDHYASAANLATDVTWTSDTTSHATVDSATIDSGLGYAYTTIHGIAAGTATITAHLACGPSTAFVVTVAAAVAPVPNDTRKFIWVAREP